MTDAERLIEQLLELRAKTAPGLLRSMQQKHIASGGTNLPQTI